MRAEHGRRRTDDRELARRAETVAPLRPTARDEVLALQRSAGNAAVARLLQRDEKGEPRKGGWNEAPRAVTGTQRIPVKGLKTGNQEPDSRPDETPESAAGRAIVVVPDGIDLSRDVEVLLFFHGKRNLGFRERKKKGRQGPEGSVHDLEADRIPQQLAHSGRNIIGVLPQGTNSSGFGIADPDAYVKEVLGLAATELATLRPDLKLAGPITPGRIIVSGHSGGGVPAVKAANKLTATAPADDEAWVRSPPLFLFDGINGTTELTTLVALVERWLAADLARLSASKDPKALLDRRKIKLRSTHTTTAVYEALNLGGDYVDQDNKPVHITKEGSLKGRITKWFSDHGSALGAHVALWHAQYEVPATAVGGSHEYTVGTGSTAEQEKKPRLPAPSGVTGPSKAAGVPDYGGGGNLEESLSKLSDVVPPLPPPKHALNEDEEAEDAETAYA